MNTSTRHLTPLIYVATTDHGWPSGYCRCLTTHLEKLVLKQNVHKERGLSLNLVAEPYGATSDLEMNSVHFRPELQLAWGNLRAGGSLNSCTYSWGQQERQFYACLSLHVLSEIHSCSLAFFHNCILKKIRENDISSLLEKLSINKLIKILS